jgi:thiamine pyrophosphate-dependent acetolactate synthase large subunit-like protein
MGQDHAKEASMNVHQTSQLRGFQAIAELVRRAGIDDVFGLIGGSNAPWVAHGVEAGWFRFIRTRHEDTAVTAAAGYARSTGRVSVCTTTKGPGLTNAMNGLVAAARGHVPLLVITGGSRVAKANPFGSTQVFDQETFARNIGVGYHDVDDIKNLETSFWSAALAAVRSGKPQILCVAERWFDQSITLLEEVPDTLRPGDVPEQDSIVAAIDELALARQPLILAGWGAVMADCRQSLTELAELSGALLANSLRANRFFAGHERDIGLCGSWAPPAARSLINECDLVLSFGASLNGHTTEAGSIFGGAKIVQCEIDENQRFMASSPDLFLYGDAAVAAKRLLKEWKRRGLPVRPASSPAPPRSLYREGYVRVDLGHDPERGLDPRAVYRALDERFPADRIVVTDNGRFLITLPNMIEAPDARSWLVGNAYGTIGLGLGAAIGAAVAHPDRQVLLVTGDGGFSMAAQDLDAIRLAGLDNITIAIINDELYGSDVKYLARFGLSEQVLHQSLVDIPDMARLYGGTGYVVTDISQLKHIDLDAPGPKLLDIRVDPKVNLREAL